MNEFRIALANVRYPATPEESVILAEQAIADASRQRAGLICFPECFVPGYRRMGKPSPPPDAAFRHRVHENLMRVLKDEDPVWDQIRESRRQPGTQPP